MQDMPNWTRFLEEAREQYRRENGKEQKKGGKGVEQGGVVKHDSI